MSIEFATTFITAFNGIVEIAKSLKGIRDSAIFDSKVSELMGKILEVNNIAFQEQISKQALSEKVGTLEKEILDFKNWEAEKIKYYLHNIGIGTFVYALKDESMNEGETFHQICATCYERKYKSILQYEARKHDDNTVPHVWSYLVCNSCKNKLQIHRQLGKTTFTYLKPSEAFV